MKRFLTITATLALLAAGFAGGVWHARRHPATPNDGRKILYWVDPMNPSHTSNQPGFAPCGMKLEPVYADESASGSATDSAARMPGTVRVSTEKQQLIGVRTAVVERKPLTSKLRLLGKVAVDETRVYRINATVDGWITKALPIATGDRICKGQTLATFYSPEFLSAGQALLFALTSQDRMPQVAGQPPAEDNQTAQLNLNLQQFRDSLRNLGMGDSQIDEMTRTRKFASNVDITSPSNGFVILRNVSDGLRFDKGTELFRIADLSHVWILTDVFERNARALQNRSTVRVSAPNQGLSLDASVSPALPQFDPATRVLKFRLEADNPEFTLKPEMFVDVELSHELPEALAIPAEAIVDAGVRKSVFVDCGNGVFEPRAVVTGERSGDHVQITHGLMAGERIVVSGNFLLDSESRMKMAAAGVHRLPAVDPVCGMTVDEPKARAASRVSEHQGKTYLFCNDGCKEDFDKNPEKVLQAPPATSPSNDSPASRDQSPH